MDSEKSIISNNKSSLNPATLGDRTPSRLNRNTTNDIAVNVGRNEFSGVEFPAWTFAEMAIGNRIMGASKAVPAKVTRASNTNSLVLSMERARALSAKRKDINLVYDFVFSPLCKLPYSVPKAKIWESAVDIAAAINPTAVNAAKKGN